MSESVFLTGASGFIGSYFTRILLGNNYKVYTISRQNLKIYSDNHINLIGHFYDKDVLAKLPSGIDCIIHCAAIRGETISDHQEYQKVNIDGTKALLEYAKKRGIPYFLYISTVGVLGSIPKPQPASIQNQPNPDGKYHQSKWQAEELVRQYQNDKLNTLILRPTITYGMGDNGFITKMIDLIRNKRFILPAKEKFIHLLYIEGFSRLIIDILKNNFFNNRTYIVADKEPISLWSLVDIISNQIFGRSYPSYLKWPDTVFCFSKTLLRLIKNQKLLISLRLISENWIYDISDTIQDLGYNPFNTSDEIK